MMQGLWRGKLWPWKALALLLSWFLCLSSVAACAEDGSAAWLRYAPVTDPSQYRLVPSCVVALGNSPVELAAAAELQRGLTAMLGRRFDLVPEAIATMTKFRNCIVLASTEELDARKGMRQPLKTLTGEQYEVSFTSDGHNTKVAILGGTPRAELYGAFHLLEGIAAEQAMNTEEVQAPAAPIRWVDEWDNLNGTIERGYAGPSIFFAEGHVRQDLARAGQYARLLASVGINGCNVNNVNADLDLLTTEHLREFARIAEVFRPWGVKLALSIDLTSPQTVGGLPTFDPLDPRVIVWWKRKVDEIYTLIPDFGGFTVKADSEGRKGPSQYGRSPVDAANVLARALAPHGGVVLYRGFVYNNHLDWRDSKADRARAGVDNFVRYDGQFAPNVVIQIKEGPIDFQAREPVSPLFAALRHTNVAIEVQTSQEYTGQERHMVWLPSMWKWVLDTDLQAGGPGQPTPVREIVEGKSFERPTGGFVSVTNVGMEANWLHHPMAMANLYGFGKLAWNPGQSLSTIIDSWTRLTWGNDPVVDQTIDAMQLASWHNYESYTGPNGMGSLTDILGVHFGPGIETAERNGWGQWFRGEKDGIGMDRTVATGTGYAGQYPPGLAARYESLATCPDELLLFFHHVPYDFRLHSGKTLVQSIFDAHYAGALAAARYVPQWMSLEGKVDEERYRQVLALFTYQAGHAVVWRDAIDSWFRQMSGIEDAQGRVGHDPHRIEAEDMVASGYEPVDVMPSETASGGKAVVCKAASGCTLRAALQQPAGRYDIAVQYFDLRTGVSQYTMSLNGGEIARWAADAVLPPAVVRPRMDGQTSTRFTVQNIAVEPGDVLELRGVPDLHVRGGANEDPAGRSPLPETRAKAEDARELAPVDYIEFGPPGAVTPQ